LKMEKQSKFLSRLSNVKYLIGNIRSRVGNSLDFII